LTVENNSVLNRNRPRIENETALAWRHCTIESKSLP